MFTCQLCKIRYRQEYDLDLHYLSEKHAIKALEAENAKLRQTLESIEAIIQDDMGDWYDVEYAHLPIAFSNRAHIRDAINDLYALLKGEQ